MNKKIKWAITAIILVVVLVFSIVTAFQRQYQNILIEVIVFPWGWYGRDAPVYRFIIQNDGTFITYVGTSIHGNVLRSDIIMWPFRRRRAELVLSDEDFGNILEVLNWALENYDEPIRQVQGWRQVKLLYDGNIYEHPGDIHKLADEIIQLSPLMTQYHGPWRPGWYMEIRCDQGDVGCSIQAAMGMVLLVYALNLKGWIAFNQIINSYRLA